MKEIRKYELSSAMFQTFMMPGGAEILSAQSVDNILCLWALVDADRTPKERNFRIYRTGQDILNNFIEWVGTVQQAGGQLTFHIFEDVS